ncbi:MAG: lysine-2,3-aminomutase-like protein [Methylobacteriaceae bacterium]|nr:lysine-2,3-aminomutase-like protein [Methylobacteriaceae bacterium]MBV9701391.1 lysine-2,3-aminomutase-like protein [Methylobacteriaceae bacterium]
MTSAAATLRTIEELETGGLVAPRDRAALEEVAARYAVAIPPAVLDLIDRDDPHDPIARQFVPSAAELQTHPDERADPIGDRTHSPIEGIVHRYPDRVLLKLVSVCAVYCRFCFRREMVGPLHGNALSAQALSAAVDYIRARPDIWEVIVSGGDPFMLSPRRLAELMAMLAVIAHVKVVRFHTRVPVVAPDRIDADLIGALRSPNLATYVALHANHPRELAAAARAACARIIDDGIPMLSQTVLLRGVNDSVETLAALMRAFVEARVKPYYLHHPDLAPGTAHFRLTIAEGQALTRALRGRLSGLCQPTYVLDIPGGHGKAPVGPTYLVDEESHVCRVQDYRGLWHNYPQPLPDGSTRP